MPFEETIRFDNTFASELDGFYVRWQSEKPTDPNIIQFNAPLAVELGLSCEDLNSAAGASFFAGGEMPEGSEPLAQAYAGHQFGGFSQQLGDGRALLIGEIVDTNLQRRDIQLKGSGKTPFSRGGDGKAVLGPVLREYLFGEAMHALGIPTTRALAAVTTGEQVMRETVQPGAVLTRVASSHLRVGTFQFFAARGETDKLRRLADYTIKRHFPDLVNDTERYLGLLKNVIAKQASLVAKWVSVGFVHGVMNTDNVTISGETIDYGPCAFIDQYDPNTVFSSIDTGGRYAYGNQPIIAQWNLARFAEALLVLIDPDDQEKAVKRATDELNKFPEIYQSIWLNLIRKKIGLSSEGAEDAELINNLHSLMDGQNVDFTLLFRNLAEAARGNDELVQAMFKDDGVINGWLVQWRARMKEEDHNNIQIAALMDETNPLYIARNHKVEEALNAAVQENDMEPFGRLLNILRSPFQKRDGFDDHALPAPEGTKPHITFCGT